MNRRNFLCLTVALLIFCIGDVRGETYPILYEKASNVYYWQNACDSQGDDCFNPEEIRIFGLILPADLPSFWKYVNIQLPDLQYYEVEEGNEYLQAIDGVLFSKDGKTLIAYPCGKMQPEYHIPEGVQWIGEFAFSGNPYLETIVFSNSVEGILNSAFASCSNLHNIHLNENLRLIANRSFEYCKSLQSVSCPSTLQIIGSYAFRYSGLMNVKLNNGLISIGGEAFAYCDAAEFTITLPSSLIDIHPAFTYTPSILLMQPNSYASMVQYIADHTICYTE